MPPQPPRRSRTPLILGLSGAGVVIVVVVVLIIVFVVKPGGSGSSSSAAGGPSQAPATITPYRPPSDGTGYSTKPVDQPNPFPDLDSSIGCNWLSAVMPQFQQKFQATGKIEIGGDGCHIYLPGGEELQVFVGGPYSRIDDPTTYLKPLTLDGLDGRLYAFSGEGTGECVADINTRSLDKVQITSWNPDKAKDNDGRREARCQQSKAAMDILVKAFIPLAGGTPVPGTIQQPDASMFAGKAACNVVGPGPVIYANDITDQHPKRGSTKVGSTCRYSGDSGTVTALLTTSTGGLSAFPNQLSGSKVTNGKLGTLPARTEQTAEACTVAVQVQSGQVLAFTYQASSDFQQTVCYATTTVAQAALQDLINNPSGG